jgi:hypothetical protein
MFAQESYKTAMEYTKGMEARMEIYANDPNHPIEMAEDIHYGCTYLMMTARRVVEGRGNVASLQKASKIYDRLCHQTLNDYPDRDRPGLSPSDLTEFTTRCQAWYEIFNNVIKCSPPETDAATLCATVLQEVEFHNYREQFEPEEDRFIAHSPEFDLS